MFQSKEQDIPQIGNDGARGAAVYTPATLALYDWFVLGFSNALAWKCPSRVILDLYNQHVSQNHLDIGVGTGYFLDHCRFPSATPAITLFDLNSNSLRKAARRLRRYAPSCHLGNVLEPIDLGASRFDSIALNYLLHCLPGDLASKSRVFENLKPLLKDGGSIFGSTILGKGVKHNALARKLMSVYNAKRIFSNLGDSQEMLETALATHFSQSVVRIQGCVALFSATK